MPLIVLDSGSFFGFWKENWYLALFFILLIAGLNSFFLVNRKVFVFVEREDWSGLTAYLVKTMFGATPARPARFRSSRVRLLINAYLLQSDAEGIARLEEALAAQRPDLLRKNALLFGVTRLLTGRNEEAEAFFKKYLDAKDADSADWLRFDYGFSLIMQKRIRESRPYLEEALSSSDAVLRAVAAYLLGGLCADAETTEEDRASARARAEEERIRLKKRFDERRWRKEVERAKSEVHIVILSKLVDEAGRWLREE
jgi:tetratricopeptide (TPR) repeat protein